MGFDDIIFGRTLLLGLRFSQPRLLPALPSRVYVEFLVRESSCQRKLPACDSARTHTLFSWLRCFLPLVLQRGTSALAPSCAPAFAVFASCCSSRMDALLAQNFLLSLGRAFFEWNRLISRGAHSLTCKASSRLDIPLPAPYLFLSFFAASL